MKYRLNTYHVLLSCTKDGMVICVPKGDLKKIVKGFWEDIACLPEYYGGTYQYLKSIGIEEI